MTATITDFLRKHGWIIRKTPDYKRGAPAAKPGPAIWGDKGPEWLVKTNDR